MTKCLLWVTGQEAKTACRTFDITDNTVIKVTGRLSGEADMGGTESVSLQHWILRFGAASWELQLIVADLTEWSINGRLPWISYCSRMSDRLIALIKKPGV